MPVCRGSGEYVHRKGGGIGDAGAAKEGDDGGVCWWA